MRTRRELDLWNFEQLCANEIIRRRVINDIKTLRKWTEDISRNKPTSAGVTKARMDRADRKPAPAPVLEW